MASCNMQQNRGCLRWNLTLIDAGCHTGVYGHFRICDPD